MMPNPHSDLPFFYYELLAQRWATRRHYLAFLAVCAAPGESYGPCWLRETFAMGVRREA